MAIYRGPGGSGDAVNDASSEATITVQARDAALAAQAAAEAAQAAAELAETNAETAETNAETAETNAETAATAAQLAETNAETAQAAAEAARDASINLATNFDVDANTLSAGSSATASYDTETFLLTLGIPRGDTGATGATGAKGDKGDAGDTGAAGADGVDGTDGRGIVSITRTSGTGAAGTTDTFTITYTDATTSTFQVYNGADGVDGTDGIDGTNGTNGTDGADGADGRGIVSVTRTSGDGSAGTTDTYTITYTDATTSTFSVYNGANGTSYTNSDVDAHLNTSTAATDQVLAWNGSDYDWVDQSGGGSLAPWSKKTANYTAVDGDRLLADTSAGTFTITLPATPTTGHSVVIADGADFATTNLTVARNSSTIEGLSEDLILDVEGTIVTFVYDGSTWEIFATIGTGTASYVTLAGTQTLTNKTLTDPVITGAILEDVYTITDGAAFEIDPSNGTIQLITLGASRTPKATNFAAGESVTLMVLDGTAYTITWTDATFGGSGVVWVGGSAPTLDTTKYTVIELWKVGSQVYGALVGAA